MAFPYVFIPQSNETPPLLTADLHLFQHASAKNQMAASMMIQVCLMKGKSLSLAFVIYLDSFSLCH